MTTQKTYKTPGGNEIEVKIMEFCGKATAKVSHRGKNIGLARPAKMTDGTWEVGKAAISATDAAEITKNTEAANRRLWD